MPDGQSGAWWPPDAKDTTVWNAWCHGTPGTGKAFALGAQCGLAEASSELLLDAARGICAANTGGYCLCHGVASRLDALLDIRPALGVVPTWLDAACRADAAVLTALDPYALQTRDVLPRPGAETGGLMTGAAGVTRTLLRYGGRLETGQGRLLP